MLGLRIVEHLYNAVLSSLFTGRSDSQNSLAAQHRSLVTALTKKHRLTGMTNILQK